MDQTKPGRHVGTAQSTSHFPASLEGKRLLSAERGELWISKTELLKRYAVPASMETLFDEVNG